MKIAFWSNTYEQSMVSFNLAAISISTVMRYPYSVSVMENYLHRENLGLAFMGTKRAPCLMEVGTNYYEGGGMEGLLRGIYRGNEKQVILRNYLKEVIPEHLYYLPQSGFIHNELFDYEMDTNIVPLLDLLNESTDINYIGTAPYNLNSKTILDVADLIVINLCQNQNFLDDFIQNYSTLIPQSVFVIGNYSHKSILSCKRISNLYDIPLENIVPIPWNEAFQEAKCRGRTVEFMNGNYRCNSDNPNFRFVQAVRKATYILMRNAELTGNLVRRDYKLCGK